MYVMLACFAFLFFEIPFCYIPGLALNSAPSNQSSIQLSSGSWDYKHICTIALDLKAFTLERSYFEIIRLKSMNSLFSHKGITFPSTYHTACACQEWTLKSKVTNFCLHVHKQHTENLQEDGLVMELASILNCFHLHLGSALTQRTFSGRFFLTSIFGIQ